MSLLTSRAINAVSLIGFRISLEIMSEIQKIVVDQSRNERVNPHSSGWVQADTRPCDIALTHKRTFG